MENSSGPARVGRRGLGRVAADCRESGWKQGLCAPSDNNNSRPAPVPIGAQEKGTRLSITSLHHGPLSHWPRSAGPRRDRRNYTAHSSRCCCCCQRRPAVASDIHHRVHPRHRRLYHPHWDYSCTKSAPDSHTRVWSAPPADAVCSGCRPAAAPLRRPHRSGACTCSAMEPTLDSTLNHVLGGYGVCLPAVCAGY